MKKKLDKAVKIYLIFGGIYMFFESLVHFFNFRLVDVGSSWPGSAIIFSSWMSIYYASLSLFLSILLLYLQTDVDKNKQLIKFVAIFATFHGGLLLVASQTVKFDDLYRNFSSLSFWLPTYNGFLIFESILLFSFALLILFWQKD